MSRRSNRITLAITGASGVQYGLRLLECLVQAGKQVNFLVTPAGQLVLADEADLKLPSSTQRMAEVLTEYTSAAPEQITVYGKDQWTAPIASGSAVDDAMVVCPCTVGCLSAIATSANNNLLERAADVIIKERRPLILMVRETPFSSLHLDHMLRLSNIGVTIMPANPGFYHQPKSIEDLN